MKTIKVIGFDADDTLWVNEPYYQETEKQFCELLSDFLPAKVLSKELFKTEMDNLELYGYGAKGFMLSMIETALRISNQQLNPELIDEIIRLGKELLEKPIVLLDGVQEVLDKLRKNYKLIVATKGDLLDQERKLSKSGLSNYFHHIEIMSDKKAEDYSKVLAHLDCVPDQFLMIGNSLKSDILPVLELGGHAIHVPFHTTWAHEHVYPGKTHPHYIEMEKILDILKLF